MQPVIAALSVGPLLGQGRKGGNLSECIMISLVHTVLDSPLLTTVLPRLSEHIWAERFYSPF